MSAQSPRFIGGFVFFGKVYKIKELAIPHQFFLGDHRAGTHLNDIDGV